MTISAITIGVPDETTSSATPNSNTMTIAVTEPRGCTGASLRSVSGFGPPAANVPAQLTEHGPLALLLAARTSEPRTHDAAAQA